MPKSPRLTQKEKDLTRRYLVWCYKTTKESLDRIDRYFTQLQVDDFVLHQLRRSRDYRSSRRPNAYRNLVDDFEDYKAKKEQNVLKQKFTDSKHTKPNSQHQYLQNRLNALEKAIIHFLGKKDLAVIRNLYEKEMTQRILSAREHT